MVKKIWLWLFIFLLTHSVWCQTKPAADSLANLLKTNLSDKEKVNTYNLIAEQYRRKDTAKVARYTLLALKLAHKIKYPKGLTDAYVNQGYVARRNSNYTTANKAFRKILNIAKQYNYPEGEAIGYKWLGLIQTAQSNYDQALAYYEQSVTIYKHLDNLKGIADTYNNTGIIHFKRGSYSKALGFHFRALPIRKKLGTQTPIAVSYNNIGIVYLRQGNYPKALSYLFKSLKIKEQQGNLSGVAGSYANISVIYIAQKNNWQALKYLFKALKIKKKYNHKRSIANIYNNIALVYFNQKNVTQALYFYTKALKLYKHTGNKRNIAKIYNNLAELAILRKQYKQALRHAQKAFNINQKIRAKVLAANTLIILGRIHYFLKNYNKALVYLNDGVKLAREMQRRNKIKAGAHMLAQTYSVLGHYQKAYQNQVLFQKITNSLLNESNAVKITHLADEYKFQKETDSLRHNQDKERIALNAKLAQEKLSGRFQHNIIVSGTFVLMIVLVLAFFLYRSRQRQKLLNVTLMQQSEQLQHSQEEVLAQRDILALKNTELSHYQYRIGKSFKAARLIQHTLLPTHQHMQALFKDHFIFYAPKDVVSGDFYWISEVNGQLILVVADCTGHGVPGAFMTLIGSKLLDTIIKLNKITEPSHILAQLNQEVQNSLRQRESYQHQIEMIAGMDAVVLNITPQEKDFYIRFAGAKSNLLYIDAIRQEPGELTGTRKSVGGFQTKKKAYKQDSILLPPNSLLYLGSDGLRDQNNEQRKRFGYKALKELLQQNANKPMTEQKELLQAALKQHMQGTEQRDDILWMGLKL